MCAFALITSYENGCNFFYALEGWHIVIASSVYPSLFCLEHNFKTTQGINMKLQVDRSHWEEVQCTRTITQSFILLEFLSFVHFHSWILSGAELKKYSSYWLEISQANRSHWTEVQYARTITQSFILLELLPIVYFHSCYTWILFGA